MVIVRQEKNTMVFGHAEIGFALYHKQLLEGFETRHEDVHDF
jgi:hypothetical protein